MAPGTVALLIKMIYDGMDEYFAYAYLVIYKNMFHVKHAYNNPLDEEML